MADESTTFARNRLTPVQEKFIVHWGEMGARWGVNRTVAQIHALLYLSPVPLNAEEIATQLSVARSNVSNGLHELLDWGLIRSSHILGDRREHYEAVKDVWDMLWIIVQERKRREIDPAVAALRACSSELAGAGEHDKYTRQRVNELLALMESISSIYEDVRKVPPATLRQAVKLRGKIRKAIES